jgi:hypothetical protein
MTIASRFSRTALVGGMRRLYRRLGYCREMSAASVEVVRGWIDAYNARTGRGSGASDRTPIFVAVWLRAAKVMRVETFTDRSEALGAVALET